MSNKQNDAWNESMAELKSEKIYEATIKNAETNEILTKVSSYSLEGLEEEMGKEKFTKFAKLVEEPEIHKCEFCDETETTKYPAEGQGDVYLCEDCRSRDSGPSADL